MITPGRLPKFRDDLVEFFDRSLPTVLAHATSVSTPWVDGRPEPVGAYVHRLCRWLRQAELFYVSGDMCTVAVQAGSTMPRYQLHEEDLPAPVGLLVWQQPIASITGSRGGEVALTAALWGPAVTGPDAVPAVHLVTLTDAQRFADTVQAGERERHILRQAPAMYHEEAPLPLGTRDDVPMVNEAICGTLATWLLCGQELAEVEPTRADRPVRRAYTRAGRPEPTVRHVTLRQPRHHGGDPTGDGRDWKHQWMVRGHWRQQWYPSQQRHRPRWIPAHLKGPEGKPLIGGDKVHILRR